MKYRVRLLRQTDPSSHSGHVEREPKPHNCGHQPGGGGVKAAALITDPQAAYLVI